MTKSIIKTLLKFLFAGAIIAYMLHKGTLDFSIIATSFQYKTEWIVCLSIIIINVLLTTYRWKLLLEIKSSCKLPFSSMARLTWIGLFFSSILPGAVTGDLVKLLYARDLDKNLTNTFLLTSALLDRIIGLLGLLFLLGIFSIIYYSSLTSRSLQLTNLIHFNFLVFLGVIVFLSSMFLPKKIQNFILNITNKIPAIGNKIGNIFSQVWLIGENQRIVLITLALSLCIQILNVFAFWFISRPFIVGAELSLQHAFTFIPLGFVTMAIPISPGGIGVGHAAFDQLFSFFGVKNGASLFNLYFICWISVNLLGIFAYIASGKRYSLKDTKTIDTDNKTNIS